MSRPFEDTVSWEVGDVIRIEFAGGTIVRLSTSKARQLAQMLLDVADGEPTNKPVKKSAVPFICKNCQQTVSGDPAKGSPHYVPHCGFLCKHKQPNPATHQRPQA